MTTRTNREAPGTGVGAINAHFEAHDRERITDNWTERTKRGQMPGTHSLGREYAIVKVAP